MPAPSVPYDELLNNWDFAEEDARSDFLETLRGVYDSPHLYTGLWQRYKNDLAIKVRNRCLAGDQQALELLQSLVD